MTRRRFALPSWSWQRAGRRRLTAVGLPVTAAVIATLLGAAPAEEADEVSRSHTKLPTPQYGRAVAFEAKPRKSNDPVPAGEASTRKQAATKPVWPTPGSATVELRATASQKAKASGLPVTLAPPAKPRSRAMDKAKAAKTADAPAQAKVTVLDRKLARKLGVEGLVLSVQRTDGDTSASSLSLSIDYSGFAQAYGGAWASRLRAIELPACALTSPDRPQCRTTQVLPTSNDAESSSLTTQVTTRQATTPTATTTVVALSAGASSDQGSYQATSLSASSTWAGGGSNGDFTWTYPMDAVPAPAGTAPTVTLGYSAQSIDGRTSSTSAQTSWVGEGFDLPTSYIERSYSSCDDDGQDDKADLCWKEQNASVVLNGKSSPLIKDADGWHLKNDDGEKVTLATGAVNGDDGDDSDKGEYWTVTATDGTQYVFGKNRLPGWSNNDTATDDPVTNSTWVVPVFGDDPGEPGYSSSTGFSGRAKLQAWRWNLDYVVDPHGNVTSYWYSKEGNYYAKNESTGNGTYYHRGGWLKRIDYGQRSNTIYSKPAAARVQFAVAERCIPVKGGETCESLTESNKAAWPDVPFDQICAANTACTDRTAPSFFSRKRLADVTTQVYKGTGTGADSDYRDVNTWHMEHSFPDPGDGSAPGLWLKSIQQTGKGEAGAAPITLPAVTFEGIQLHNRVDKTGDDVVPYIKWRVRKIISETGSVLTVNYSDPECIADTNLPTALDKNTKRCYPVKWIPPTNPTGGEDPQPRTDFFHKYVVTQVSESDPTGGAPLKETHYSYTGGGAWAYDDESPITPAKYRTWNIWRGYNTVTTIVGEASATRLKSTALYYRGMHGDKQTSGTRTETITDSQGVSKTDSEQLAGQLREQITYNGTSGQEVTGTIVTPWSLETSSDSHSYGTVRGHIVRTGTEVTRTRLNSGGTITSTTTNTYDPTSGMPLTVEKSAAGEQECTRTWYATDETMWMLTYPKRVEKVSADCSATPNRTNDPETTDLISETRLSYDDQAYAAAPVRGNVTRTERLTGYNTDGSGRYQTVTTAAYDALGRPTATWNTKGIRTKHIAYTPAAGGPVTQTVTTNALGHTATAEHAPDWGVDTSRTDANGNRTELAYDALGRLTDVWLADRDRASGKTPSHKFEYAVQSGAASWVATKSLNNDGTTYLTQYAIYDALLRPRQVQVPAAAGTGRVISETKYDTRGLATATAAQYIDTKTPSGALATLVTAAPAGTETTFDGAGRATVQKNLVNGQEHSRTTTTYDGNTTTVLPPAGAVAIREEYDARGRLAEKREYNGSTVTTDYTGFTYTYDHADRLKTAKDTDGNTWSLGYDFLGRQTRASDPDAGSSTMEYNDLDQTVAATDARNKTIGYTYDNLGRQTARVDGPVPLVGGVPTPDDAKILARWSYDTIAKGQLTSSIRYVGGKTGDVYALTNAEFDELNRVLKEQYTISSKEGALAGTGYYTIKNAYNLDGTLQKRTIPAMGGLASETLDYGYTSTRLPDTLQGLTGIVQNTDYLPAGEHIRTTLGVSSSANWTDISYEYEDGTQRLARQAVKSETHTGTDADIYYRYDKAGNPTEIDDRSTTPGDKQCFAYDGHRRLKNAWTATTDCATTPVTGTVGGRAPYWQSFTYDSAGNRKTTTDHLTSGGPSTTNYTYKTTSQTRPHALDNTVTNLASGTQTTDSYTYWENGATKTRNLNGTTQTLDWDVEGELAKVTEASGETTTFLNDGDGNRLIRRDATGTTLYLGETELRLDKASGNVTATRYYTHAGKTVAMRTPSNLTWLSTDHHGTADLQIDATTQALTRRATKPFGEDRGTQKPATWRGEKGFVGGIEDPTGLTHLGAREYDTKTGRFISVDPIGDLKDPQQINGYAYSNNNPVTFSDPTGLILACGSGGDPGCPSNGPKGPPANGGSNGGGNSSSGGTTSSTGTANWNQMGQDPSTGFATCTTWTSGTSWQTSCATASGDSIAKRGGWKEFIAGAGHWGAVAIDDLPKASWWCWIEDCSVGAEDAYDEFISTKGVDTDTHAYNDAQTMLDIASVANVAGLARKLLKTLRKKSDAPSVPSGCKCFLAGTPILMADGTEKRIDDIDLGDKVLATDPESGEQGPREVTSLIVTQDDKHFNELSIATEEGIETLTATHEHPFWSPSENDWIEARDLKRGTTLLTDDGQTVIVTGNRSYSKSATTYNLTVDDLHTYYVLAGNTPVLVHNANCANPGTRFDVPNEAGVYTIHLNDGAKYVGSSTDSMRTRVNKSMRSKHAVRKAGYTAEDVVNVTWIPLPSRIGAKGARRVEQTVMDGLTARGVKLVNQRNPEIKVPIGGYLP
ncbi:polymorphic toxin-type HINT domain-containing protein [Streptomyces werraensis]|uniref:Polymorphic toxin-type HINT domain-containing protein n=2 Tax=Streptomyces werraensis TaxID=68284 RepID=A0ABV3JN62_9ACTN